MKRGIFVFLTILFFCNQCIFSQECNLDNTFGVNGIVYQSFNDLESNFKSILVLPNGKLITAENFHQHGTNTQFVINRYKSNGVVDETFGNAGVVSSSFQNTLGAISFQSSGKIVGYAKSETTPSPFSYLFRYNLDGTIDTTFENNGVFSEFSTDYYALTVQRDDKILVAKSTVLPNIAKITRYTVNGLLDSTFGVNGEKELSIPSADKIIVKKIVQQNDGQLLIVAMANYADSDKQDILIIKLNSEGQFDSAFSEEGMALVDFYDFDSLSDVIVQKDGKIVLLLEGYNFSNISVSFNTIVRLLPDSSFDFTFGVEGRKSVAYPIVKLMTVQQLLNGKLLVSGVSETSLNPSPYDNPTPLAIEISQYNENGDLDLSLGSNVYCETSIPSSRVLDNTMLVQTNGKIIMGVTYCESWFSCHPHTLVLGYDANLLLETGEEPVVNTNFLIYPNPVKESISLDFNLKQSEKLSVQLLDSNGREIVSLLKDVIFKAGANTTSLILPRTLQNGMYFLNITNETKRSIFKIIK